MTSKSVRQLEKFILSGSEDLSHVVVIVEDHPDHLKIAPIHGGTTRLEPRDDFKRLYSPLSNDKFNELANQMTAGEFGLEDDQSYPGYASSLLWNGFTVPAFEQETVSKMMSDGFFKPDDGYGNVAWFDEDGVFYVTCSSDAVPDNLDHDSLKKAAREGDVDFPHVTEDGETLVFDICRSEPRTFETPDGPKTLYAVGAEYFCWQKDDEPDRTSTMSM